MNIDWNPVIQVLDELSDGTHSFLQLSYMASDYGLDRFLEALMFLADRGLVEMTTGLESSSSISSTEMATSLRKAFGSASADAAFMAETSIDLSDRGAQVLHLFNIGHPPLSTS
jgi:hypothetical protein